MPSRWPSTGTRASAATRATSDLPPRGMIRSMAPPSPASIAPTASRSAVGDDLDAALGQARFSQPGGDRFADGEAGGERVGAAPEDQGVAGAQADRGGVGGDVGPALEDHADDADRGAHPGDVEAVGARPARHLLADGIGQSGDLLHRRRDRLQPRPGRDGAGRRARVALATSASLAARMKADAGAQLAAIARIAAVRVSAERVAQRPGAPPAPSCPSPASSRQHHQIVAVDQGVGAAIAEQGLDPRAALAGDERAPPRHCRRRSRARARRRRRR